ncbi:MAG TPA: hypothetical protein PKJ99_00995 [Thermoanaerobaculales bacterium]|nr:hypothetical protein [Thermoanaerobaculales bacterium]HPA80323.1 hypothetical protein [Thermoanaerobaculales bacterium]HQN95153.1 hypothetical protein [Thermoanaerobaculales bacterium]HQP44305.1 hypothetical protein [Thermoanaerobaculales bacterium]
MITFIQCVRRRPELSIQQFRESWRAYGVKAEALARATGAVGLSMNTTLAVEPNLQVQLQRGTSEPYDGLLKISWPNAAGLKAQLERPEVAEALEAFQSHQQAYFDLEHSSFFFGSEETLVGDRG